MTASTYLVRSLDRLLFLNLHFIEFLIYCFVILIKVFVYQVQYCLHLLYLLADIVLQVVNDDGQGHHFEDIELL